VAPRQPCDAESRGPRSKRKKKDLGLWEPVEDWDVRKIKKISGMKKGEGIGRWNGTMDDLKASSEGAGRKGAAQNRMYVRAGDLEPLKTLGGQS